MAAKKKAPARKKAKSRKAPARKKAVAKTCRSALNRIENLSLKFATAFDTDDVREEKSLKVAIGKAKLDAHRACGCKR